MASWGLKEFSQDEYSFRIYDNVGKKKHQTIMKETGCCDIINLAYFNMTKSALPHESAIMIAGKWGFAAQYHEWGICIDKAGKLTLGTEKEATYDYAVGLKPLVIDGKNYNAQPTNDANGVTYIGIKANGNVVLYLSTKDRPQTTAQATATMKSNGCIHILRYDGSWSSAGHLGTDVTPSQYRIVRSHLLVFRKTPTGSNATTGSENTATNNSTSSGGNTSNNTNTGGTVNMSNIKITQKLATNGANYKRRVSVPTKKEMMIHSTAMPGSMFNVIYGVFNNPSKEAGVEYVIDDTGIYQILPDNITTWHCGYRNTNETYSAVEICEHIETCMIRINWQPLYRGNPKNRPYAIKRLQQELLALGFDPNGVDGSFGPGCEAALKAYQKANGLTVDGSCGKLTLDKMAKRKGSYMAYNPANAETYFNTVYNYAVQLTAHKLKTAGGSVDKILCHSEGYDKGIASNHSDVMHWFPYHGKNMNIFREDVRKVLAGGTISAPAPVVPTTPPPTPAVDETDTAYSNALRTLVLKDFMSVDAAALLEKGNISVDSVRAVIQAAARKVPMTDATAVDLLVSNKVIDSGDYWKGTVYSDTNVKYLIIKIAKFLYG